MTWTKPDKKWHEEKLLIKWHEQNMTKITKITWIKHDITGTKKAQE